MKNRLLPLSSMGIRHSEGCTPHCYQAAWPLQTPREPKAARTGENNETVGGDRGQVGGVGGGKDAGLRGAIRVAEQLQVLELAQVGLRGRQVLQRQVHHSAACAHVHLRHPA